MSQLIVRKIDQSLKNALKARAKRKGHSMEAEVRQILSEAVDTSTANSLALGSAISQRFQHVGLENPIIEQRGSAARPAVFDNSQEPD